MNGSRKAACWTTIIWRSSSTNIATSAGKEASIHNVPSEIAKFHVQVTRFLGQKVHVSTAIPSVVTAQPRSCPLDNEATSVDEASMVMQEMQVCCVPRKHTILSSPLWCSPNWKGLHEKCRIKNALDEGPENRCRKLERT